MLSRTLIKFSHLSKLTDWLKRNFKNHDDIIYHVINVIQQISNVNSNTVPVSYSKPSA